MHTARTRGALAVIGCGMMLASAWAGEPDAAPASNTAAASATPKVIGAGVPVVTEGIINAPVSAVWAAFSTAEGFKKWGVAQCDLDLRVGGLIRTHYKADGVLGDEGTVHNRILAFEPERMMAFCIDTPPKGFPFKTAWRSTWTVATLTDLGDGRTHLRLTGLGYGDDEESRKMREFFSTGNRWSMDKLRASLEDKSAATAPAGKVHEAAPTDPVVVERTIDLPREQVWARISTAEGWKAFLGVTARIDPQLRPQGPFEIEFDSAAAPGLRGSEGCTVLSALPGRMLSFTWNAPPAMAFARQKHTWVVIELVEPSPGRTTVRLTHQGFKELAAAHPDHATEFAQCRAYFAKAWVAVVDALAGKG